jgi:hypothetical protein
MKSRDRRAIRRGYIRFFTHSTRYGHYYSAGSPANDNDCVYVLHVPRGGDCEWISVPESYFRAEFWEPPHGAIDIPRF